MKVIRLRVWIQSHEQKIGTEVEEWFRGKPKAQDLMIKDLKALEIVTANSELVKDDGQFQYALRKSNQKELTQAEAKAKRKQSKTNAAPSPLKTPIKGKRKVRTKRYNMNEISMLLTSNVKRNRCTQHRCKLKHQRTVA